jgi:hypothetical protein
MLCVFQVFQHCHSVQYIFIIKMYSSWLRFIPLNIGNLRRILCVCFSTVIVCNIYFIIKMYSSWLRFIPLDIGNLRRIFFVCFSTVSVQYIFIIKRSHKKSLKIPKGLSESVNRRSADNSMVKRKSTKGQTTIYKTDI